MALPYEAAFSEGTVVRAREHGIDIMREGTLPPLFCTIKDPQRYARSMELMLGCWGIDLLEQVAPSDDIVVCCHNGRCKGHLKLSPESSHNPGGNRRVLSRYGCPCLRLGLDTKEKPMRMVFMKKYESAFLGACGILDYFMRKLCVLPMRLEQQLALGDRTKYKAFYWNKTRMQVLDITLRERDGSFFLCDTMIGHLKMGRVACDACGFVSNERGTEFRYFFGLCCGANFCEECVSERFTSRDAAHLSLEPFVLNQDIRRCNRCNSTDSQHEVYAVLGPTLLSFHAPVPVAYFGMKWCVSPCIVDAIAGFFQNHIEWLLPYYFDIAEAKGELQRMLARVSSGIENEVTSGTEENSVLVASMAEFSQDIGHDLQLINELTAFLRSKRPFVVFALEPNVPFPEQLLDLDGLYYEKALDRVGMGKILAKFKVWQPPMRVLS